MRIIVLDESKKRTNQIVEFLQRKKYDYVCCSQSSEFVEAVTEKKADKILVEYDAWRHGRAIYNYLDFTRKMEDVPVVCYNAPESFTALNNRKKHSDDRVVYQMTEDESFEKVLMEL
jgi:DNA-binding response OmpR family regulator